MVYWYSYICYTGLTGSQLWHLLYSHICYTGLTGSQLWHFVFIFATLGLDPSSGTPYIHTYCADSVRCPGKSTSNPANICSFTRLHWNQLSSSGLILQLSVYQTAWSILSLWYGHCDFFTCTFILKWWQSFEI